MRRHKPLFLFPVLFLLYLNIACGREKNEAISENLEQNSSIVKGEVLVTHNLDLDFTAHLVTFIELGADKCIPCKAMQPIMKEIAEEYVGKIQVVFYDVWKDPRPARHYRIQLIPTQVFIDSNGKEIFRHVGLFPKDEILDMLKEKEIL
ncbi:MAG: thioredoxin family protein [Candidatus Aminicenantes bacterium]|nr:thioredoxin family protein [Candidatus Aminicenantes bacterium]